MHAAQAASKELVGARRQLANSTKSVSQSRPSSRTAAFGVSCKMVSLLATDICSLRCVSFVVSTGGAR